MSEAHASGEDRLIAWIRRSLARQGKNRIGDDGAILPAGPSWSVTTDQQVVGVHFQPDLEPGLVAERLLAVNLSDIAAMGSRPAFALVALNAPSSFDVRAFFRALLRASRRSSVELIGGDLARSPQLSITMTLFGRREPGARWLRRSNARPGDELFVGGALGRAIAGLRLVEMGARLDGRSVVLPPDLEDESDLVRVRAKQACRAHLLPQPQVTLGLGLARRRRVAAIDISDGLALDLHRLCRESGVGAQVELAEVLPRDRGWTALHRYLGIDPRSAVLAGGDDYRLLFTLPSGSRPPATPGCRKIGSITEQPAILLREQNGTHPLPPLGFDHFGAG